MNTKDNHQLSMDFPGIGKLSATYIVTEKRETYSPAFFRDCCFNDISFTDQKCKLNEELLLGLLKQMARKIGCQFGSVRKSRQNELLLNGAFFAYLSKYNLWSFKVRPLQLIWLRHSRVSLPNNIDYFPSDDMIVLSREGVVEAQAINLILDRVFPVPYKLYASRLTRAQQTVASLTYNKTNFQVDYMNELQEWFPSYFVGKTLEELYSKHGRYFWHQFIDNPELILASNDPSLSTYIDNAYACIEAYMKINSPYETRFIVSHGLLHNLFIIKCMQGNYIKMHQVMNLNYLHSSIFDFNLTTRFFSINKINTFQDTYFL